jgi:hypothetical protein
VETVQWSLADVALSAAQDIDPAPGVQIDVVVNTSLAPGVVMTLLVGEEMSGEAVVDSQGSLIFKAVTMPYGSIRLTLAGRNQCRDIRSSRNVFVFDAEGDALCAVVLVGADGGEDGIENWNPSADADAMAPGFQGRVTVVTGRSGITARLLVLRVSMMEESAYTSVSTTDRVEFVLPFEEDRYAVRALCEWSAIPVTRVSATHTVDVDGF